MKFVSRGNGEYLVVAESVESGNVNPLGFNFLSLEYPSYLLQTQTNSFSPLLVVRFGGLKTKEKKIEKEAHCFQQVETKLVSALVLTPCTPQHAPILFFFLSNFQFSSVAQSCPTLCDPMNRSTPGLPVHHQLLEFTQTHVHRVSDAIQPSHPRSSGSPPAPNPSQHQSLFQ